MEIKRSVLVPYPREEMFDLIEQAEHYPLFLPWCTAANILERSDDWVAARIDFKYLQVRFGFQTRNPKQRPEWLKVRMVEGPFRRFEADWLLSPLGSQGCRIQFALAYEVSEGLLDRVAAHAVELVARSMMDAFVKRAEETLVPISARPVAAANRVVVATRPLPAEPLAIAVSPATPDPITPDLVTLAPIAPEPITPVPVPVEVPVTVPTPTTGKPMTIANQAIYDAVRACPLSTELNDDQTAVLASLMQLETYAAHQVVAQEGGTDNRLYVVVDGSLSVIKQVGGPEESLLLTLKVGDFAHELGFLDGAQRYASLVAGGAAKVLVLERQALESLIQTHPMILYRVMCAIVRTVHRIQTRLSVQASELTNYIVKQHGRY